MVADFVYADSGLDHPMKRRRPRYCLELGRDAMVTLTMRIYTPKLHAQWAS